MSDHSTRHVLILLSDPAVSPVTGWPVGFWWSELTHAWLAFRDAGYAISIASPRGGDLEADMWSDPEHQSGYAEWDIISMGFKRSPWTAKLIRDVPALDTLDLDRFDALYVAGGQGPMITMIDDGDLHDRLVRFYETGKPLCIVCHASALLLKLRLSNGDRLVTEKTWTGFADSDERYSEAAAGTKIQPFWIETEARKIEDTNFITGGFQMPFAVRDGNLITGQQNFSGGAAALKVIEALGR